MKITPFRNSRRTVLFGAAVLAVTATLAGCSGQSTGSQGQYGFPEAQQDKNATITVWVDATRAPAVKAFEQANPSIKVKAVTYDGSANGSNSFKTKMGLYDRAGKGWPDVVFSSQNNDASWASQKVAGKQPFAARLDKGLIPAATLSGFATGALAPCTVEGGTYCLRNDLAQTALWYDKSLLAQFGYSVPTTWQEYQALGEKVAKEHPGYIVGSVGDTFAPEIYMWASKCQANDVTGPRSITVDTTSADCKRMASLIDTLVADKSLTTLSVFSPDFVKQYTGKVLLMPGPSWYAGALFNNPQSLNTPKGQLGVAAPLPWQGEQAVTGNVGGGTWFISSHSQNLANAAKFAEFVTTADAYQVDQAPGFPAYKSAADKWLNKQQSSGYYATDLSALTQAAGQIWTGWGYPSFSQEAVWAKTMTPLLTAGKPLADNLDAWGTAISDQAKVNGYTVK
ncbi:ABC transporter substrate-binding protein [Leifsonia shinshuensis]|uniref:Multiple sugar transport system substrate-binding protein n=1 Tax=Leifsonia shinshuensis TaxID=150026 RepID=A0A853CR25_9MICO|nr:ABC transporter substrate-binding protein [Leifsonia shinshuensis]NYJ22759.1 multiple sugar transport system substrate-binding protein [Leifsonia shinshuensis]